MPGPGYRSKKNGGPGVVKSRTPKRQTKTRAQYVNPSTGQARAITKRNPAPKERPARVIQPSTGKLVSTKKARALQKRSPDQISPSGVRAMRTRYASQRRRGLARSEGMGRLLGEGTGDMGGIPAGKLHEVPAWTQRAMNGMLQSRLSKQYTGLSERQYLGTVGRVWDRAKKSYGGGKAPKTSLKDLGRGLNGQAFIAGPREGDVELNKDLAAEYLKSPRPKESLRTALHEFAHVAQNRKGGAFPNRGPRPPKAMTEGGADLYAQAVAKELGLKFKNPGNYKQWHQFAKSHPKPYVTGPPRRRK